VLLVRTEMRIRDLQYASHGNRSPWPQWRHGKA
jgi:hypothetical protein